jgi:hypothetical protein
MPKGPNGQKRPADSIGCAVLVGRIATGEIEESAKPKGVAGGVARAKCLSSDERSKIAKAAAEARWSVL